MPSGASQARLLTVHTYEHPPKQTYTDSAAAERLSEPLGAPSPESRRTPSLVREITDEIAATLVLLD